MHDWASRSLGWLSRRYLLAPPVWRSLFGDPRRLWWRPATRQGLVKFSRSLQPLWRFPNAAQPGPVRIDDCEGINVSGDVVWMSPYYGFPVVRIRNDKIRVWNNPAFQTNIGAVLVDEATSSVALVAASWSPQPGRTAIGCLTEDTFEPQGHVVIRLPDGRPIPSNAQLVAQGTELHVFVDHDWYRIHLGNMV